MSGKGHQKGSRRPTPTRGNRDRGARPSNGYQLGGDVPWPLLGDGTEWCDALTRVEHKHVGEWKGTLQSVEWCHPDGSYMKDRGRTKESKANGSTFVPYPGAWYGQVSWDLPDDVDRPATRQKLVALVPEA